MNIKDNDISKKYENEITNIVEKYNGKKDKNGWIVNVN
jgi:hypothetical protein